MAAVVTAVDSFGNAQQYGLTYPGDAFAVMAVRQDPGTALEVALPARLVGSSYRISGLVTAAGQYELQV